MAAAAGLPLEVDDAHGLRPKGQLGAGEHHVAGGVEGPSDALCR